MRLIHSVASDSALRRLEQTPAAEVLVQVNVAGEEGKEGILAADLGGLHRPLPRARHRADDHAALRRGPRAGRPYFARLAELAGEHGLERLSMGTSQDYGVAVQEGATIVRLGSVLYE